MINKALAGSREPAAYWPALTFASGDRSTIGNTCRIKSNMRGFDPLADRFAMIEDPADENQDRRNVARTRVRRNAKIIVPRRSPIIHCTVQNITDGGACLKVANTYGVPETFELTFEHGRTRRACRVVWRTADEVGVAFEDAGEQRAG